MNILDHPIALSTPRRLSDVMNWQEHIPFGMWLVDVARPRTIVELGTHKGDSYCAFCQTVAALELETRCFAVDSWEGDDHAGNYGPDVLEDLRAHHNPLYSGFSELLHMTFNGALARIQDNSVDLLHIDGCHRYDDARRDFESWIPRLTDQGVVLLHDTTRRLDDFGVWRLLEELSGQYPTFEFTHSHGLAVLLVGERQPDELLELTRLTGSDREAVRSGFAALGSRARLIGVAERNARELERLQAEARALHAEIGRMQEAGDAEVLTRLARIEHVVTTGGVRGVASLVYAKLRGGRR